ncbi:hypothetical protein [Maritalea porphyrae]|uniref:hypothetical protein n=1 Tax=Maritalea porphyrae TaxID=880732 RepID=UPI0022AECA81|nr:hypothetical protein [Maritalea porphyrae]MCZ4274021.1 hypothetical protein [Maritalea porphyrae]
MKTITTPQLDLALKALERAEAECKLAAEQDMVGASGIRGTLPTPSSATIRHTALTVVRNKNWTQQMAQCRAQVDQLVKRKQLVGRKK